LVFFVLCSFLCTCPNHCSIHILSNWLHYHPLTFPWGWVIVILHVYLTSVCYFCNQDMIVSFVWQSMNTLSCRPWNSWYRMKVFVTVTDCVCYYF
jgi:hypothetical protein